MRRLDARLLSRPNSLGAYLTKTLKPPLAGTIRSLLLMRRDGLPRGERQRRRRIIQSGQTDLLRWSAAENYNTAWAERLDAALSFIGGAKWVADIGCGMQELRRRLSSGSVYLPMDIRRWTEDTVVCDINKRILPTAYIAMADVCVMMGLIEYIYDPEWLFQTLGQSTEAILFSYNAIDICQADRVRNGWVNSLSIGDCVRLTLEAGFRIEGVDRFNEQVILKALNTGFGDALRAQRDVLRAQHEMNPDISSSPPLLT